MVKSKEGKLTNAIARIIDPGAFPGHLGCGDPGFPDGMAKAKRTAQAIIHAFPAIASADLIEAQAKEIAALKEESAELTKALTGLTCGGSEFFIRRGDRYVADIPACVEWVKRRDRAAHDRSINALLKVKKLEALLSPSDSGRAE